MTPADRSFLLSLAWFVIAILALVYVGGPFVRWLEKRAERNQRP
ncbi:MAG: hypothetical protein ACXWLM_07555 [Myxococcales bacterium]